MNYIMGMLKEKPKILYLYTYIKTDEERVKKDNFRNFEQKLIDRWYIESILFTEDPNEFKNEEFYKFICTYRRAFIGDMQKQFDQSMGYSNMVKFAESIKYYNREPQYKTIVEIIYKNPPSLIKRFWKWFRKKEYISELPTIEDYLNNVS